MLILKSSWSLLIAGLVLIVLAVMVGINLDTNVPLHAVIAFQAGVVGLECLLLSWKNMSPRARNITAIFAVFAALLILTLQRKIGLLRKIDSYYETLRFRLLERR